MRHGLVIGTVMTVLVAGVLALAMSGASGDPSEAGSETRTADLEGTGAPQARGTATLKPRGEGEVLAVHIRRLRELGPRHAYVLWLRVSGRRGYPLSPIFPRHRSFDDNFAIPKSVLSISARAKTVDVRRSRPKPVLRAIKRAARHDRLVMRVIGTSQLRGAFSE